MSYKPRYQNTIDIGSKKQLTPPTIEAIRLNVPMNTLDGRSSVELSKHGVR